MKNRIKRNWYRLKYRDRQVKLGKGSILNLNCQFEGSNSIGPRVELSTVKVGFGTYICENSVIRFTHIGRFCSIGKNLQTGLGTHPTDTFVSTHPSFFSTSQQAGFSFVDQSLFKENTFVDESLDCIVSIGHDVWIGNNVTIMDGLTIGNGAIIAAGAVVTKDVEPYSIVGGIPSKLIRYRFSLQQIELLLKTKWWDWDIAKIRANRALFVDIDEFSRINSFSE